MILDQIPLKMMKSQNFVSSVGKDPKCGRSNLCIILPALSLLFLASVIGITFLAKDSKEAFYGKYFKWGLEEENQVIQGSKKCENQCQPPGSEFLPKGIISKTSDLERRTLWGKQKKKNVNSSTSLFSAAVGIKQKELVDKIVRKFLSSDFAVMLFHYDGILDEWKDLSWTDTVIHISAVNQTKWWFAKRFLHPDIVTEYDYIFIWDEDLGVDNFDPSRYLVIVKREGLEISQPALDHGSSEVHHLITARGRKSDVHRRAFKSGDSASRCDWDSKNPPCTGWIEVMAPVFSRAAWRCVWLMIQNDLIHAWGLDIMLGYCAQGNRTQNIGVVDAEYIAHYGLPTLGKPENKTKLTARDGVASEIRNSTNLEASSTSSTTNYRFEVRRESYNELKVFRRLWKKATEEDECWTDPYPDTLTNSML